MTATFKVPSNPYDESKLVYFFPGLEPTDGSTIVAEQSICDVAPFACRTLPFESTAESSPTSWTHDAWRRPNGVRTKSPSTSGSPWEDDVLESPDERVQAPRTNAMRTTMRRRMGVTRCNGGATPRTRKNLALARFVVACAALEVQAVAQGTAGAVSSPSRWPATSALGLPCMCQSARSTPNHMVQRVSDRLDTSFAALSDATRRGVLDHPLCREPKPPPTLHAWMGGDAALERLFRVFYERVPADPILGPVFATISPEHVRHVAAFVGEVLGAPTRSVCLTTPSFAPDGPRRLGPPGHASIYFAHPPAPRRPAAARARDRARRDRPSWPRAGAAWGEDAARPSAKRGGAPARRGRRRRGGEVVLVGFVRSIGSHAHERFTVEPAHEARDQCADVDARNFP